MCTGGAWIGVDYLHFTTHHGSMERGIWENICLDDKCFLLTQEAVPVSRTWKAAFESLIQR